MGIRFYSGDDGGENWTLIKEWDDSDAYRTYPAITKGKDDKFYL